jgi:hypothetical protein
MTDDPKQPDDLVARLRATRDPIAISTPTIGGPVG